MLVVSYAAPAAELDLAIADLAARDFSLKGISARLSVGDPPRLTVEVESVHVRDTVWRQVRVACARFAAAANLITCEEGTLQLQGEAFPIRFSYDLQARALDLALTPGEQEQWHVEARFGDAEPRVSVEVKGGRLSRLARWMPAGWPRVSAGAISGTAALNGAGAAHAELTVEKLAFSDAAGTRAAEGIGGKVRLDAMRDAAAWRWQAFAEWRAGEAFWQPVYLKAEGQQIDVRGELDDSRALAERARLTFPGIGAVEVVGAVWDRAAGRLTAGRVEARRLPLGPVYDQWLKPFLAASALSELRAAGEISGEAEMRGGAVAAAELRLDSVSFEDRERRFAVFGLSGHVPWLREGKTRAEIALQGGEILKVPFGAFQLGLTLHGDSVGFDRAAIPVLGGTLTVSDFSAARTETGWRWAFGGELAPVSVDRLTQVVGLPLMHGTLSGVIPQVRYEQSTLSIGGALIFNVFDGTVTARDVLLSHPFGRAPRLNADLEMRGLDLDLLTRTFSFGGMTGRVDATVAGLELVNWQPVRFDARIESSPGDYRRTISQTAVENISALGGAGAAAAIQRSFLRFFDRFGYEKLALSCVLRDGVCTMGGIGPAEEGSGYVIVKGGGIPALSVIGYNRKVSWNELVTRLKRIVQDNVQAVIK